MAEKKKRRSVGQDALIGSIGGVAGGVANAIGTHPFDTYMTRYQQSGKPKPPRKNMSRGEVLKWRKSLKPKYSVWKAPFHREMWEGVGTSVIKKGLGFGIGLGTTFTVSNMLRKLLDKDSSSAPVSMNKLGFHKYNS